MKVANNGSNKRTINKTSLSADVFLTTNSTKRAARVNESSFLVIILFYSYF